MTKDKFKNEKDFEDLSKTENNSYQTSKIKEEISKIITNEIKIVAKNDSQKKLLEVLHLKH